MTRNNLDEHLTWLLGNAGVSRPNLPALQASYTGAADRLRVDGAQRQGQSGFPGQGTEMPNGAEQKQRAPSLIAKQRQLLTPASVTPSGRFEQTYSQFLKNSR